ncbi:RNA lariat debranching enzyme [Ceraceosorus bombacis]|uniref:RNA lariat debranching enzyme n=1 Tax=Ceraceosorus bombacis TaxID=401625 RepID=A0A0P1BH70_9BASI|nr:RNA lariat debranching enzyme [Ceraceosorus bombacis]
MRVAVQGCSHGALDSIYASIRSLDAQAKKRTDLVLLCGDFQALRNVADLETIAVPDKYKQLGDFVHYYTGLKQAEYLTLVVGGNHEASAYMWELYHGGWLAPNIYYLGAAGSVQVGGLDISGISGIYKSHDYRAPRYERLPYDRSTVRSTYHTRQYDVMRLGLLYPRLSPNIFLSHDWPNTIEQHGDTDWLKRKKPFFTDEINSSTLGNPPLMDLLQRLKPQYWFAAHLHVRFAALYKHDGQATRLQDKKRASKESGSAEKLDSGVVGSEVSGAVDEAVDESVDRAAEVPSSEQIDIELSDEETAPARPADEDIDEDPPHQHDTVVDAQGAEPLASTSWARAAYGSSATKFLALSKCLAGQDFLQILEVEAPFDVDEEYAMSVPMHPSTASHARASEPREAGHDVSQLEDSSAQSPLSESAHQTQRLPTFRYIPRWLAITRATHSLLCLARNQRPPLPHRLSDDAELQRLVEEEERWVKEHLLSAKEKGGEAGGLDRHPLAIASVQTFVKTAPGIDVPEGARPGPPSWYTNPQTQALCDWLQIPNKINPSPSAAFAAPSSDGSASTSSGTLPSRPSLRMGQSQDALIRMGAFEPAPSHETFAQLVDRGDEGTMKDAQEARIKEEEGEIARIQEAARAAMSRSQKQ